MAGPISHGANLTQSRTETALFALDSSSCFFSLTFLIGVHVLPAPPECQSHHLDRAAPAVCLTPDLSFVDELCSFPGQPPVCPSARPSVHFILACRLWAFLLGLGIEERSEIERGGGGAFTVFTPQSRPSGRLGESRTN